MDSPQLREVLLNSCWNYYLRSVTVVDQQLFMSHRSSGKRSQYYSSFLESSLLACGTRISTSPAVRKLGRSYAERAKQHIADELEQPTIATLQGFLLLSDFEATAARDRVGWTYNDCSRLVKHEILSELDVHLRDSLLLSAFVYDRLWALYLGRPSCVPSQIVESKNLFNATPEAQENTLHHWVHLCNDISEITDILNGFGQELNRSVASRLSDIGLRISKTHEALPPRLSSKQMPNLDVTAYGLNMQFCGIQIVLHRALVKIFSQQGAINPGVDTTSVERSRIIMYDSAACISRLTLAFREIFGVENFITVMLDNMYIAASTLISHIVQPPLRPNVEGSFNEAFHNLSVIAETIRVLQNHYPVAEKMRRTLARICGNTPLAGMFGVTVGMQTTPPASNGMDNMLIQAVGGSWGSMEALVHDDSILSQPNFLGEDFQMDLGMVDLNMSLLP
ncbi:unnamed protein product [Clonostachys rosea]|uniref:Xylanolytic transcriptional activator regulatory domain-containing protein n=1 Tax=Bionectria ochroleuca TaxID=29856 RepID=A0ABY6U3L7_BIOOC|nr:unnamed protein product [Clonostachys rosea]